MKDGSSRQTKPDAKLNWILISGVAFLVSLIASAILIIYGNRLDDLGIAGNIYYIILIPLGFSSAAFLAGAMKSYASFKSNEKLPYGKIQLTGPIVIFILVVGGGFIMPNYNKQATFFDLKLRIVSPDKEARLFNEGSIVLNLGRTTVRDSIHAGEVEFNNIPIDFHNKWVRISAYIPDYQLADSNQILLSKKQDNMDIVVIRTPKSLATNVRGTVIDDANIPIKDAFINFGSGLATAKTDENGDFKLTVPVRPGEKLLLKILVDGVLRFNDNVTVSAGVPYDLRLSNKPKRK